MYESSLLKNEVHKAVNKGFRFCTGKGNKLGLQLYGQEKRGVNADYDKRGLLENGINTYPIDYPKKVKVYEI